MGEPLKALYTRDYVRRLAAAVAARHDGFSGRRFQRDVFDGEWEQRALKARMHHIRECLHRHLALPYPEAVVLLMELAPDFGSLEGMFLPDYVEAYGLNHWQPSMRALACFTRHASAEFAVRPFLSRDPERMLRQLRTWSRDGDEHLRRLASEGSRPRLPWALALPEFKRDPAPLLPILDQLRADPSPYVRRSVANNLNDIAKDNPGVTLDWARRWYGSHPHTDWIIKHACRTLLKRAHPEALNLFAYAAAGHVAVPRLRLARESLHIGDTLEFELQLTGLPRLGRLRVEYGIDYVKADGRWARKIFKIAEGEFAEQRRSFRKRHSLRQMTTRRHYPGRHRLAIIINGVPVKQRLFHLLEAQ